MHYFAVSEGLIFWSSISSPRIRQHNEDDYQHVLYTLEIALVVGGCP